MDRVRLGRALGNGTRHAAKTLAAVAEAAAAPNPGATPRSRTAAASNAAPNEAPNAAGEGRLPRGPAVGRLRAASQVRKAGRSVWGPLATFSGALWLRVTGVFFALVAVVMAGGAWRLRAELRSGAAWSVEAQHFWVFVACAVLFGYFAVSGFLRASQRERRGR